MQQLELNKRRQKNTAEEAKNKDSLNAKRDGGSLFDLLNKGEEVYVPKKIKTTTLGGGGDFASNQTSSILSTILGGNGGEDLSPKEKERTETSSGLGGLFGLIKYDHMPLRKSMNWFSKTFDFPEVDSVNSPEVLAALWPKGADLLF